MAAPKPDLPPATEQPRATLDFFGTPLSIGYDPALQSRIRLPIDNQGISESWKTFSSADFPPLLTQLSDLRQRLQLNDWGYYQLAQNLANAIQPSGNDANLFSWFLLSKAGFRCKVGYSGDQVFLLAPAQPILYDVPFFNLDGLRYFNLSALRQANTRGQIFTYAKNYPGADRPLQLGLSQPPRVGKEPFLRQLHFAYGGKDYGIAVAGNRFAVRFLENYPQSDFPIFFDASVSSETEQALLAALSPLVAGKTETEAVNLLLRFVQTAFTYQTDEDQFGREKYLFVEETLFFPSSDCEDRAILFSFLVRKLTGLAVIGLHFPGHMATAVKFSTPPKGDTVTVDGQLFTVCDPTYINANIGMAMPQFKKVSPEVIRIGL